MKIKCFFILLIFNFKLISQSGEIKSDSFIILKEYIELEYEVDYQEFSGYLDKLAAFGDIHYYVLDHIEDTRRTPLHHEYYPAFLNYVCNNMDSVYRESIIGLIKSDSIESYIAFPLVRYCLFESVVDVCRFLKFLPSENISGTTISPLQESLILLKIQLDCSDE